MLRLGNMKTYNMRITLLDDEYYKEMPYERSDRMCANCTLSRNNINLYHVSEYKGMLTSIHKGKPRGPIENRRLSGPYCNTHAAVAVRTFAAEWKQYYALHIIGHWVEDYS